MQTPNGAQNFFRQNCLFKRFQPNIPFPGIRFPGIEFRFEPNILFSRYEDTKCICLNFNKGCRAGKWQSAVTFQTNTLYIFLLNFEGEMWTWQQYKRQKLHHNFSSSAAPRQRNHFYQQSLLLNVSADKMASIQHISLSSGNPRKREGKPKSRNACWPECGVSVWCSSV